MAGGIDTKFVRGAEKLRNRIASIRQGIALPDLTKEIGNLLLRRTLDRFDKQVDPDYVPWPALTEQTLRRKKQGGWGDKPALVRTKALRDAIKLIRGGQDTLAVNTGAGVRIGVEDPEIAPYARAQNYGVPGRIPARRFLGIGQLDVKSVDSLMRRKKTQLGL